MQLEPTGSEICIILIVIQIKLIDKFIKKVQIKLKNTGIIYPKYLKLLTKIKLLLHLIQIY